MTDLFLTVLNMSITAGYLVLAIVALRLIFRKAPRWIFVALWAIVALRLICPITIESRLSLIPDAQPVPQTVLSAPVFQPTEPTHTQQAPAIPETEPVATTPVLTPEPDTTAVAETVELGQLAGLLWLCGAAAMILYAAISYWLLRRRVATAIRLRDRIYESDAISSPFVLGLLRPRIYLPTNLPQSDAPLVIAHEQAHIRRRDHWWKPLGFLLLAIHWFNPLLWLAYILLCRDIELACDERVIASLDTDRRADYSQALLHCSINRRLIAICPLAFGELGVKERVKNVLNYKKPAFGLILTAIIASILVAVCFLTDPLDQVHADSTTGTTQQTPTAVPGPIEQWYQIRSTADRETGQFQVDAFPDVTFCWNGGRLELIAQDETTVLVDAASIYEIAVVDLNLDGYPEICLTAVRSAETRSCYVVVYDHIARKTHTFHSSDSNIGTYLFRASDYLLCGMKYLAENETFHSGRLMLVGSGESAELTILTTPQPMAYTGSPIVLYDKYSPDSPLKAEITLDAFPGVIFKWDHSALIIDGSEKLTAVKNGVETQLFPGYGFINSVYLADVTGDGYPDFCANGYHFFSGLSSFNAVYVYDYANSRMYVLSDANPSMHYKNISYYLRMEQGQLICDKIQVATGEVLSTGALTFAPAADGGTLYLSPLTDE